MTKCLKKIAEKGVEVMSFVCDVRDQSKVMRKSQKGNIINLSSLARHGAPEQTNYSASKAAIEGFTKALSREIGGLR